MDRAMQEAPQALRGRMFNRESSRPKEQRILVLKTGIAGMKYHIENDAEREAIDSIVPGTELMLFREPQNEFDRWAVAVHLTAEDKLGYITRYKNETIARLMDAGKKFVAVVDAPETGDNPETDEGDGNGADANSGNVRLIKRAPTENMAVQFSIYLVEEV